MKSAFRGHYPPTEQELESLWTEGLLVLDTNALLNLFRYTPNTRQDFLGVLAKRSADLWIPHHVGVEFHRRRLDVIHEQRDAFTDISNAIQSASNSVVSQVRKFSRHPSLEASRLIELINEHFEAMGQLVAAATEEYDKSAHEQEEADTFAAISDLLDKRVGSPWDTSNLEALYERGKERYELKRPPGYEDAKKREPDRYGDLVIWEQLLEHARAVRKPAIFITDDGKRDWWHVTHGRTLGPRPELVEEYYDAAGHRIHFYAPERFLAFARERGLTISDASLSEIQAVSVARKENSEERAAQEFAEQDALRTMRVVGAFQSWLRKREDIHDRVHHLDKLVSRLRVQVNAADVELAGFDLYGNLGEDRTGNDLIKLRAEREDLKDRLDLALIELDSLQDQAKVLESEAAMWRSLDDASVESLESVLEGRRSRPIARLRKATLDRQLSNPEGRD